MEDAKSFGEKWAQYREKLKKAYPGLTEEDLKYKGDEEATLKHLQEKLNKTKHEIRDWLSVLG